MDLLRLVLSRGVLVVGFPGLHPDGDGAALAAVPGESEYGQAAFVYAGLVGRYGYRGGIGRLGVGRRTLERAGSRGQTQDRGYNKKEKAELFIATNHSRGPTTATRKNPNGTAARRPSAGSPLLFFRALVVLEQNQHWLF